MMLLLAQVAAPATSEWSAPTLTILGMVGACLAWLTVNFFKGGKYAQRIDTLEKADVGFSTSLTSLTTSVNNMNVMLSNQLTKVETIVQGEKDSRLVVFEKLDHIEERLTEHGEAIAELKAQGKR